TRRRARRTARSEGPVAPAPAPGAAPPAGSTAAEAEGSIGRCTLRAYTAGYGALPQTCLRRSSVPVGVSRSTGRPRRSVLRADAANLPALPAVGRSPGQAPHHVPPSDHERLLPA